MAESVKALGVGGSGEPPTLSLEAHSNLSPIAEFLSARGGGGGAAANRAISLCISLEIYLRVANIAASAFYFLRAAIFIALPAKNIRRASD